MKEFGSLDEFALFLATRIEEVERGKASGLASAGWIVSTEAKSEIGVPQGEAGPFHEWQPLSSATMEGFEHPLAGYIQGKTELGYTGHLSDQDPLLRTGAMRDSIGYAVDGTSSVTVGSTSQIAVYQELGTPNAMYPIPGRSFLGGALYRKRDEAIEAVAREVVSALTGTRHNRLAT